MSHQFHPSVVVDVVGEAQDRYPGSTYMSTCTLSGSITHYYSEIFLMLTWKAKLVINL